MTPQNGAANGRRPSFGMRVLRLLGDVVWRLLWILFGCFVHRILFPMRREGPNLPRGPVLLAPNHTSFLDPVVVQSTSFRHLSFLMTEVFYDPIAVRWLFALMRSIPVKEGRGNRDALGAAVAALNNGWAVCIFPEGGIAKDGRIQKFNPGIAALSEATGAPVVPVAVSGTFEIYPRHAKFPRLFRRVVTVRYGAPIPALPPGPDETRRERQRAYTERVREGVMALLEPEQLPADATAAATERELASK